MKLSGLSFSKRCKLSRFIWNLKVARINQSRRTKSTRYRKFIQERHLSFKRFSLKWYWYLETMKSINNRSLWVRKIWFVQIIIRWCNDKLLGRSLRMGLKRKRKNLKDTWNWNAVKAKLTLSKSRVRKDSRRIIFFIFT